MRPCSRVGIELSWRCNWNCATCFYHFDERLHRAIDKPLEDVQRELDAAKARGCDHAVVVGWGEPTLAPTLRPMLQYSRQIGLTTSIITNGVAGVEFYRTLYEEDGLDHLHVLRHGLGEVLDGIAARRGASDKQAELKTWLKETGKPWRANATLQRANCTQLPKLMQNLIDHGALHLVLLGFLPHYAWQDPVKCRTVAVHPAELQPILEECLDLIAAAGRMATLRYHPLCYLRPQYWKYVTNACYVLFDPWEWDYGQHCEDLDWVWVASRALGNSVALQGEPCRSCAMRLHCGGWNRHNVHGLGVSLPGLKLTDVPEAERAQIDVRGHWHDQNPANRAAGYFGPRRLP